ncbi:hypothetical protein BN2497_4271 [Janthinobacterium sp. CG23_2]|nr:hypothetical protein BN2497_4271 [Janthinobacterium sp. CG23_2]CUU28533.1 hypothetical protein BN3177_4271 [Janthinobacterium sp. CG23_2]
MAEIVDVAITVDHSGFACAWLHNLSMESAVPAFVPFCPRFSRARVQGRRAALHSSELP